MPVPSVSLHGGAPVPGPWPPGEWESSAWKSVQECVTRAQKAPRPPLPALSPPPQQTLGVRAGLRPDPATCLLPEQESSGLRGRSVSNSLSGSCLLWTVLSGRDRQGNSPAPRWGAGPWGSHRPAQRVRFPLTREGRRLLNQFTCPQVPCGGRGGTNRPRGWEAGGRRGGSCRLPACGQGPWSGRWRFLGRVLICPPGATTASTLPRGHRCPNGL